MKNNPNGGEKEQTADQKASQSPATSVANKEEYRQTATDSESHHPEGNHQESPKTLWKRFKAWVFPVAFTDAVMLLLTAFIALGTIVSAVAIGFQWGEMHKGGADTTKIANAADKIKGSAGQSATAASDFATAAKGINTKIGTVERDFARMAQNSAASIKATQKAMRMEQRAWVAASSVTGVPTVDQQFIVQTTAFNTGKTFAKQFQMTVVVQFTQAGIEPDFTKEVMKKEGVRYSSLSLLTPNGIYTAKSIVTGEGSVPFAHNPTKDDIDAIKSGKVDVYTFGRMDYVDIFKTPHWAIFCSKLTPGLVWISCKEHNDADNN